MICFASTGCLPEAGLLTAGTSNFVLLAGAGFTFAGGNNSTTLTGDVGSSPLAIDVRNNSKVILIGTNHINDTVVQNAKSDLLNMYTAAASKTPRIAIVANLGGTTVVPGIHEGQSSIGVTGVLTLDGQGDPAASFVFIAGSTLTTATNSAVVLANGTQACHVFWMIGSSATLGVNSVFYGTIIAQASINVLTGTNVIGRLLCQTGAISLDTNNISLPSCSSAQALLPNNCNSTAAGSSVTASPSTASGTPTLPTPTLPNSPTIPSTAVPTVASSQLTTITPTRPSPTTPSAVPTVATSLLTTSSPTRPSPTIPSAVPTVATSPPSTTRPSGAGATTLGLFGVGALIQFGVLLHG
jgi:hypothetical protein